MSWRLEKTIRLRLQNRFAALENLSDGENANRAWENMKENIKISAKMSLRLYEIEAT